jgi:nondiscriminating glutamyl-tRNA synthetase
MSVRVRFAPSPTGFVHIGSLRTALYNYLYAMKNKGAYILRVEDTDRTRLVEGAVEGMLEAMKWAGVIHSEGPFVNEKNELIEIGEFGPYTQSNRLEIYQKYADQLLEAGHAYYCFCDKERLEKVREIQKSNGQTPKYDGHCKGVSLEEARKRAALGESHVVRLKLPENREITFDDAVRGVVTFNTDELDDQVLMKQDGFPTYHMAVIVDDHLMKITHVIRGEEWLSSTPKHVYLYEAFGWESPRFVHLPNILNSEKKKLSKRQGDVAVEDFKVKGYLPEALINYVALVGWSPEDNSEKMTMAEMIEKFSLDRVSKSGGVFDVDKLNWMNGLYIKEMPLEALTELCIPFFVQKGYVKAEEIEAQRPFMETITKLSQESMHYLAQVTDLVPMFIGESVEPENEETLEMLKIDQVPEVLTAFIKLLEAAPVVDEAFAKSVMKEIQKETGVKGKNLFMPVRAAISGQLHGPDLVAIIQLLGKELLIKRLENTLKSLA